MRLFVSSLFLFVIVSSSIAQEGDFPFGKFSYRDLELKTYPRDTSAVAVVLAEFGKAYFDSEDNYNLMFEYHIKIKILKKSALNYANIGVNLYRSGTKVERLRSIEAVSFTVENGQMKESKVDIRQVLTEDVNKNWLTKKLAIPNVRVGSVIEYKYTLESPFTYNFRTWEFQSAIPKISSEYWAIIPANYLYNITLKGFLSLSTNTSKVDIGCFSVGANKADCSRFMYGMKNIPAFVEEEYMTAKSNFLSAINFELSEIRYFDGRVDKVTKQWRDAELELRRHSDFGQQLKRADGKIKDDVESVIGNETDPLSKAKKIFYHISQTFQWNGYYGMFTENGVKKAFEGKLGNVADINFLLIGALQVANIPVDPVILSTRSNGVPIELHPVLSDFNYVIARVVIDGKQYLLDATDPFHPFGLLPERCLNGKGRVMAEKESFWIDLNSAEKARKLANLTMKISNDGMLSGEVQLTYMGYEAVKQRRQIFREEEKKYIEQVAQLLGGMEINKFEIQNYEDVEKALIVKLSVSLQAYDQLVDNFLFNPFLLDKEKENPFKSNERLYPVDFGSPREFTTTLNLEFPEDYELVNKPEKIALSLPNTGGRFILESQLVGNKLVLSNAFSINRTVYSSSEYRYLKELYSRIIQAKNEDLIFKKKI